MQVRWANVQAIDVNVKFSQDLTQQKSLKSVNFWQSYLKNKKVDVFWDTVYIYIANKYGDSTEPCLTPEHTWNTLDQPSFHLTHAKRSDNQFYSKQITLPTQQRQSLGQTVVTNKSERDNSSWADEWYTNISSGLKQWLHLK